MDATDNNIIQQSPPNTCGTSDANSDLDCLRAVPSSFSVHDAESANWLVRKVIEARAYSAHVRQWAEQELRRATREEQTLTFLFGRQLEAWARAEIDNLGGRRKSLSLPSGTVGYRKIAAKLVIDDEEIVLKWVKSNCPKAVTIVEKVSKSAVDAFMESTGSIPDEGAHIEPEAERFFIR